MLTQFFGDIGVKLGLSAQRQEAENEDKGMAKTSSRNSGSTGNVGILKKGSAARVIFFYPGEEGTYVDHAEVTLYENGIIHIKSPQEETTTHLQNCEILWKFEVESEDRANKLRLLKPKSESRVMESTDSESSESKPERDKKGSPKNPDLV